MPRVKGLVTEQKVEHQKEVLTDHCSLLLFKAGLSKTDVANYLHMTPQSVSKQFRNKSITVPVLMAVITLTDKVSEPVELKNMLRVG